LKESACQRPCNLVYFGWQEIGDTASGQFIEKAFGRSVGSFVWFKKEESAMRRCTDAGLLTKSTRLKEKEGHQIEGLRDFRKKFDEYQGGKKGRKNSSRSGCRLYVEPLSQPRGSRTL
jgi:hypothetical protein